jgi:hypothetical protein
MLDLISPIGLQIFLPIGFLVWQWQERARNWLEWWLKTGVVKGWGSASVLVESHGGGGQK